MHVRTLLISMLLLLALNGCGSGQGDDNQIAERSLLRATDLPLGFSEAGKEVEKFSCGPATLFQRETTAVAVSKGFSDGQTRLLQTAAVFATDNRAEKALSAFFSPAIEGCVARAVLPASLVAHSLSLPPLGVPVKAIRYTVKWGSTYFIEVAAIRLGRSVSVLAFLTQNEPEAPSLLAALLTAAKNRSHMALSP
jgi:hypothetical protein